MKRLQFFCVVFLIAASFVVAGAAMWWLVATAIGTLGAPWWAGAAAAVAVDAAVMVAALETISDD